MTADPFTDEEHYALAVVTNLHNAIRNLAGSGRLRAGSVDEMRAYIAVVMEAARVVRDNDLLLTGFGRQRTRHLAATEAAAPDGESPEQLASALHDDALMRAAGALALGEIAANLHRVLLVCEDMQPASGARTLN